MSGETDLQKILQQLDPELHTGKFVFCTLPCDRSVENLNPICSFQEEEGTSLILAQEVADRIGVDYAFVAAWITLKVHSALDAIGLTAVISSAVAEAGISCNVVAANYHDHLFVPYDQANLAMKILTQLREKSTHRLEERNGV